VNNGKRTKEKREMKEVKNEEVCNSFGSLLFLLSTLRSIEEEYENEIDIS